jgi:integrase
MISKDDFEKIIKTEKDIFWKAYLSTHFYGACRTSEVCHLKWKDFDFDSDKDGGSYFNVYSKKNKRTFLKYLPKDATYFIKQLQNNESEFIFFRDNKLLDRKRAYYHMTQLSKKAIGKKIDLSILRHSIATINYGKDIKDDIIAQQMGHSKSMKHNYIHNDKEKLKANAKKIYIGELPPEKKLELEKQIAEQNEKITELRKELSLHKKSIDLIMPYIMEKQKAINEDFDKKRLMELKNYKK